MRDARSWILDTRCWILDTRCWIQDPESAITREKRIKKWNRTWKLRLIEDKNPNWNDLYKEIL